MKFRVSHKDPGNGYMGSGGGPWGLPSRKTLEMFLIEILFASRVKLENFFSLLFPFAVGGRFYPPTFPLFLHSGLTSVYDDFHNSRESFD